MRAHQIMTQHVIAIGADAPIAEALDTMLRHHVSGLPVIDTDGKLIGIISEGDFIRRAELGTQRKRGRWLSFLVGADRVAADFVHAHGRKVGDIMTPDPLTISEDTPLVRIVEIMESNNVKRLPVVRGNRMVGIVTRSDLLPALADLARHGPSPSSDDDRIREQVIAAIAGAAWAPCRLKVTARDGVVSLDGVVASKNARQATIIAAENVPGVKKVLDNLEARAYPPAEEDLGGGDIVSLQEQPSTTDDEPL
ncbi:CBS domain-containing protein [Bradyrhizobium erythrophlei]|uniref:BON domain-containing protein n=1 Tax=Bradyrhizobium erythrophlei TaxID=1437360 RepID=A0A1M5MX60_9BRAD|nr:CBS domain-containing protein [Bradyrhizobium erythrophlei]SHG81805.1 BON domain-containing protein [Bradyrhizobium erythrophlei]